MLYVCSLDLFIPQTATLSLLTDISPSPTSANSLLTTILLSAPVFVLLDSTYEGDHEGIFFFQCLEAQTIKSRVNKWDSTN